MGHKDKTMQRRAFVLTMATGLCLSMGCQSFQDGARQVSLGAQDFGSRLARPFRRSGPTTPDFGARTPTAGEDYDPFLPPPRRSDLDGDISSMVPRRLSPVQLGHPMHVEGRELRLTGSHVDER